MKTCYVTMPFGSKPHPETGQVIDFDRVYAELIKPAVEAAGVQCFRSDELRGAVVIQREAFKALLGADVVIADLTTGNPNVAYELGIRHIARRGVTILLSDNMTRVPFSLDYLRRIIYDVDGLTSSDLLDATRSQITEEVSSVLVERIHNDSPLYEFFPDLVVEIPAEAAAAERSGVTYPLSLKRRLAEADLATLREVEEVAKATPDLDPVAFVDILAGYFGKRSWDDVIRLSEELPASLREDPDVVLRLSQALSRRGLPGDVDRAIHLMEGLIGRTGREPESSGMLGVLYKARYEATGDASDLERATRAYLDGFTIDPDSLFLGINALVLLAKMGDDKRFQAVLARANAAFDRASQRGETADFWMLAAGVELAVLSRDWPRAEELAATMADSRSASWQIESVVNQLATVYTDLVDADEQEQLDRLIRFLSGVAGER